jgi:NDP-sugar pyrophosphorylase family protein
VRAFILAAGEGSRLRPLTDGMPKPMLAVRGRPLLEYNVRLLVQYGITDITINTHYRPEKITAHFGDGSAFGATIRYTFEPTLLGTAGALNNARDLFDEAFLLVFGDNLSTCNLRALGSSVRPDDAGAIALFHREDVAQSGVAVLDVDDRIVEFVEKPIPPNVPSHWVNAGLVVVTPRLAAMIPASGPSDFGRDIFPSVLAQDMSLRGYRMHERLWWIDTLEDHARTTADPQLGDLLSLLELDTENGTVRA